MSISQSRVIPAAPHTAIRAMRSPLLETNQCKSSEVSPSELATYPIPTKVARSQVEARSRYWCCNWLKWRSASPISIYIFHTNSFCVSSSLVMSALLNFLFFPLTLLQLYSVSQGNGSLRPEGPEEVTPPKLSNEFRNVFHLFYNHPGEAVGASIHPAAEKGYSRKLSCR